MDTLRRRISVILSNKALDDVDRETSRAEEIELLANEVEWKLLHDALLAVLRDNSRTKDEWRVIATVFWGAVLDSRDLASDEVIALVYHRLPPDPESSENNLAWSIASRIKGIDYLSDYEPLSDPCVKQYLPTADCD